LPLPLWFEAVFFQTSQKDRATAAQIRREAPMPSRPTDKKESGFALPCHSHWKSGKTLLDPDAQQKESM
jgi:hypothetical protein